MKHSMLNRLYTILTAVLIVTQFNQTGLAQQNTILIDRSGQDGRDATNGQTYNPRPGASGGYGQDGGDAGVSTVGADGKSLQLYLRDISEGQRAYIQIYADVQNGQDLAPSTVILNENSRIRVDVSGGDGGDGGRGGDGQGGCNGSDGRDATSSSSGTDGGNGCDGGDAGRGSPGSDGGNGGVARIYIPAEDVHLALLTTCNASGGDNGARGENGQPGSGGRAGQGGSSYHNSYSVPDGETCTDSLENNGNGSYTTVRSCVTNYRTVTESNPGGSNGRSGSDGSRANGNLAAGRRGRDGVCTFISSDGRNTYQGQNPFSVRVQSYNLVDEYNDGIYEPDETIFVQRLTVKNFGDLPTPSRRANFQIFFSNTRYTTQSETSLDLPRLNPGQSYTFDRRLSFKIKTNSDIGLNQRLVLMDNVTPSNYVTRVNRSQENFENSRSIVITYPIEISAFTTSESAGAGQRIPIFWTVKNISGRDFGGESEIQRSIRTALRQSGGDASPDTLSFTSASGQTQLLTDKYWSEILNLRAGQEIVIEGMLEVSPQALAYTQHQLTSDLYIENFLGNEQRIQSNGISLRISQLYNYNPNSEFLLITNKQTIRPEYLAWKKFAEDLGTSIDIWDLSYYGRLSFNRSLEELNGKALKDVLNGKTIIALNNDGNISNQMRSQMVETISLLANQKANYLVLGGSKDDLTALYTTLMSTPLESGSTQPQERSFQMVRDYFTLAFWSRPSREDFLDEVKRHSNEVLASDPRSRFFIQANYSPRNIEGGTYQLGSVNYFRTLSPGQGRSVFLPLSDQELHNENVIASAEMFRAVLLPTSFEFKKNSYLKLRNSTKGELISDAIMYDLVLEMDIADLVCATSECTLDLISKLSIFNESVLSELSATDIELLAGIKVYISQLESSSLKRNIELLLKPYFDLAEVKSKESELNQILNQRRRLLSGISDRDNIKYYLTLPAVHRAITTDTLIRNGNYILERQN